MKRIRNRLLQSILVLVGVSILCFTLVKMAPLDPVLMYVEPNMSEEYIEKLRVDLGLTRPVYEQYLFWLGRILKGDFGNSLMNKRPVLQQIIERLPATLWLMGVSFSLSILLSIPLGLFTGKYKDTWFDKIVNWISYIGISIPTFWFAILLIYIFSVSLQLLPSIGMRTIGVFTFTDLLKHFIMPCLVLTFSNVAQFTRYIRSSTITELSNDYVIAEKAYGISQTKILWKYVLKNALLPIITIFGMSLQTIVSGAIITEQVFGWPGTGQLTIMAVTTFDYPLIMGITMFSAFFIVIGNLLADVLYTIADPRIRKESGV